MREPYAQASMRHMRQKDADRDPQQSDGHGHKGDCFPEFT